MSTYVLVPGAGGEAWYWHRLVPELEARGHVAIAVDLPAGDDQAGWSEYADAIERAIGERTEPILVAQSLAGFSASIVCARRPVAGLVLLNAMIPRRGETGGDWWANTGQRAAQLTYLASIGHPEAADDEMAIYFHDAPPEVLEQLKRRAELQQSGTPMGQPWPLAAWPDVSTRVLSGREDRLFPLEFQRRVARERLGLDVLDIPGGHLAALSRPRELAEAFEGLRINAS